MAAHSRRGLALQITVGVVTAGLLTWMGISSAWPSSSTSTSTSSKIRAKFRTPPTTGEIEAVLGALGLTPKVLAASGFTAQQTTAFTQAAASSLRSNFDNYRTAMDSASAAGNEVDRLERRIRSGLGSQEDLTALATAQSALAAGRAQCQSILNTALAAGEGEVNANLVTTLSLFRAGKLAWELPERYLGDERTDAQWVDLRDALANDRIAARHNEEPDPAAHQIVLTAQGTTNSSAAAANLANLAEIKAAWAAALEP